MSQRRQSCTRLISLCGKPYAYLKSKRDLYFHLNLKMIYGLIPTTKMKDSKNDTEKMLIINLNIVMYNIYIYTSKISMNWSVRYIPETLLKKRWLNLDLCNQEEIHGHQVVSVSKMVAEGEVNQKYLSCLLSLWIGSG